MSFAAIALAPLPVDLVVTLIRAPMETLNQLDAAVNFILPLPHFSQQGWLAQPPPTTLSPFGPTSYCQCL